VVREEAVDAPVVCTQCGLCSYACPIEGAFKRDGNTGALLVTSKCDPGRCNLECVNACPYGVIHVDSRLGRAIKCDFCGGSPACVDACPFDVIEYVEAESPFALNSKWVATARSRR
jgi:Fe-S-cluster-containing hydrogenase component 2